MNSLNFCRVECIMNEVYKYFNGLSPDHHFQTKIKYNPRNIQKQQSRGVLRKRCSKNMQQIYRRTPMPKCDFNNAFWHGCSPVNLLHIFRKPSLRKTSEGLLLNIHIFESQYPKTEMFGLDRIAYRAIKLWKKVTGDH